MAICPKLWGKQEQELIPFPVAEHPSCGRSEITLGKSKGGKKAFLLGRRSSKKPWATVSALVPSGGAPHALQGRTEFWSSLGELCCSSGTGAEVPGSAATKTAADQRAPPPQAYNSSLSIPCQGSLFRLIR